MVRMGSQHTDHQGYFKDFVKAEFQSSVKSYAYTGDLDKAGRLILVDIWRFSPGDWERFQTFAVFGPNVDLIAQTMIFATKVGLQCIIGADWNVDPTVLNSSGGFQNCPTSISYCTSCS